MKNKSSIFVTIVNIILVVIVIVLGYVAMKYLPKPQYTNTQTAGTQPAGTSLADLTYVIDGQTFALKGGVGSNVVTDSSGKQVQTSVLITPIQTVGDLNGDDVPDAAVILAYDGGGTGVYLYVSGIIISGGKPAATNTVLIGDRVQFNDIAIKDGVVTVSYSEKANPDATNQTAVAKTLKLVYKDGMLVKQETAAPKTTTTTTKKK